MNKIKGAWGESKAADYLKQHGHRILEINYRCRLGEIDIVSIKDRRLNFVEVKLRTQTRYGRPEEAVGYSKQRKLVRLASWYIQAHPRLSYDSISFDVVALQKTQDGALQIKLIEQAFDVPDGAVL